MFGKNWKKATALLQPEQLLIDPRQNVDEILANIAQKCLLSPSSSEILMFTAPQLFKKLTQGAQPSRKTHTKS